MMRFWRPVRVLAPVVLALIIPAWGLAQVDVSVNVPPPELPVYDQPPIPGDGYLWTPGYWAWSDDVQDYYWVPGTWVLAPEADYLWTPGYWGVAGAAFLWHAGYWGPHVGFYGGVNYGYGYGGNGYEGGYWQGGRLFYNRSVNNVSNVQITNVYNKTVINNVTVNRVSYNGGNGLRAQPTAADRAAAQDRHLAVTSAQQQHQQAARGEPSLRVGENKGRPPVAATSRPGALSGAGVVGARGAGTFSVVHPSTPSSAPRQAAPEMRRNETPPGAAEPRLEPRRNAEPPQFQPQPHSAPPPQPHSAPQPQPQSQNRPQPPPRPEPSSRPESPPRPESPARPAPPQAHPAAPPHPATHEEDHEHR